MKLNQIKAKLAKILASFNEVTTDKGVLNWNSDESLPEVGESVFILDEMGNKSTAEDGEYRTEDKYCIVVENGSVKEVIDESQPAQEEEVVVENEDAVEEVVEETAEEVVEVANDEEKSEEERVEEIKDIIKEIVDELADVEEVVVEENFEEEETVSLETRVAELEARIAELEAIVKRIDNEPAAEPATEEFKRVNTFKSTGDKKMDNLSKIMNASWN